MRRGNVAEVTLPGGIEIGFDSEPLRERNQERSMFYVRRSAFSVWRSTFGVRGKQAAVRTSVTLMGQDIGNTVTVLVHVLILSSWN